MVLIGLGKGGRLSIRAIGIGVPPLSPLPATRAYRRHAAGSDIKRDEQGETNTGEREVGRVVPKDHLTIHDSRAEKGLMRPMLAILFWVRISGKRERAYGAKGLTIFRDFSMTWPF